MRGQRSSNLHDVKALTFKSRPESENDGSIWTGHTVRSIFPELYDSRPKRQQGWSLMCGVIGYTLQ